MSDNCVKKGSTRCDTNQEDSSDDETEGADSVEDEEFDEVPNLDDHGPEHDEDAESLDPRIQVSAISYVHKIT